MSEQFGQYTPQEHDGAAPVSEEVPASQAAGFGEPAGEQPDEPAGAKTRTEQFTISGEKLLGQIKDLINEGNVRQIILRNDSGNVLLEIPLNAGLAVTAVAAVFAPVLVAVGAIAALLTSVSVTVVREVHEDAPEGPVAEG